MALTFPPSLPPSFYTEFGLPTTVTEPGSTMFEEVYGINVPDVLPTLTPPVTC